MLIILGYINELPTPQMRPNRAPAGRRGEPGRQRMARYYYVTTCGYRQAP